MDKVTIEQIAAIKRGEFDYAEELRECQSVNAWRELYFPASLRAPAKLSHASEVSDKHHLRDTLAHPER